MDARDPLHDPGLPDGRLLARFVQAGMVVLDEDANPQFASAKACEVLGAASETALRDAWQDIAAQLHVAEWPRRLREGSSFHGRADVLTPSGVRAVRYEVQAMAEAGGSPRIMLVRDRAQLLPTDRALVMASEADASRHVLVGLVHSAKGPLNNFNLTLALMSAGIARAEASTLTAEMLPRWKRYVGVLADESERLAGCIEGIHALALRHEPSREAIDVCALVRECVRVLRHGATMREIGLDFDDAPENPVYGIGDPRLVQLALLSLTILLMELTSRGGRVGCRVTVGPTRGPTVAIAASDGALPSDLLASLFRISGTAECEYFAVIAARLIIEAQGGDVSMMDGQQPPGFLVTLPARD